MIGRDKLETASFQILGVAQALQAMSTSEMVVREIGWALDLLGDAATEASEAITKFIEANPMGGGNPSLS